MTTYYHQIGEAEDEVVSLKRQYLQRFNWQETCVTPGSFWLWRRDFGDKDAERKAWEEEHGAGKPGGPSKMPPYGIITASIDLAVSMTVGCLDEQAEMAEESEEA